MSYRFVIVSDDYIEYLSKAEPHVMSNKAATRTYHRKYLGIMERLGGYNYFVPLSSPKPRDYDATGKIKRDTLITIYIKDNRRLYGTVKFNCMIPVPPSQIIDYDINDEGDLKYKLIVLNELYFVRSNQDKIERTAASLYAAKKHGIRYNDGRKRLLDITLDFERLEKLCDNYSQDNRG